MKSHSRNLLLVVVSLLTFSTTASAEMFLRGFVEQVAVMNNAMTQSGLDEILALCKKAEKEPESRALAQARTRLEFMENKKGFSFEEQEGITDCTKWARKQEFYKRLGETRLVKRCETGHKVVSCLNRAGGPRAVTPKAQQPSQPRGAQ